MDKVGDGILTMNANWTFEGDVCNYFDTHVKKSVPLYYEGHELIVKFGDFFLSNGSLCYDLGCSTGTLLEKLHQHNINKNIKFVGIDSVKPMVEKARKKLHYLKNIDIINTDLIDFDFEKADMIISYYTMQFVKPKNRQILFNRIYDSLNWGGAFILFEKVRASDARFQDIFTNIYIDYKLENEFNSDEIIAKMRSLKGILEPFSTQGNMDLLKRAGFQDIITVMKYVCFEGFLAIK